MNTTRFDRPSLRLIDSDSEQTRRIAEWRAANPEWELSRERGAAWRLTDGRQEVTGHGWDDACRALDGLVKSAPPPARLKQPERSPGAGRKRRPGRGPASRSHRPPLFDPPDIA